MNNTFKEIYHLEIVKQTGMIYTPTDRQIDTQKDTQT